MRILPPIRRNDIKTLTSSCHPSNIIIVDGVFHNYLSIGHAEIRDAIRQGWIVWGLSSMGAIRAAELGCVGMKGYGKIYRMLSICKDFSDDEVALLHGVDPPYFPLSEPLIHLRMYLKALVKHSILDKETYRKTIFTLQNSYFGNRTINFTNKLLLDSSPELTENLFKPFCRKFDDYRLKAIDLFQFLNSNIWKF